MKYVLGGIELILALIFLVLTIEMFSEVGNSYAGFWRAVVAIPCVCLFLSGCVLLFTGSYWSQLFILPVVFVILFFLLG